VISSCPFECLNILTFGYASEIIDNRE